MYIQMQEKCDPLIKRNIKVARDRKNSFKQTKEKAEDLIIKNELFDKVKSEITASVQGNE